MNTTVGIKYVKKSDGKKKTDIIRWNIPKLEILLPNNDLKKIHTITTKDPTVDNTLSRFGLKFEYTIYKRDILRIYFISPITVYVNCDLTIECGQYQDTLFTYYNRNHKGQAYKWQYLCTVFIKSLIDYRDSSGYIICSFQYHTIPEDVLCDHTNLSKTQLNEDLKNLLNNELYSDLTIKSVEGTEYKVHKAILASRSAVLKAHFEHNTTECHTNILESPLETKVLWEVLTFIYTQEVPKIDDIPEKLLAAADYYQLEGLKNLCEEVLYKKLTIENAIETLQIADSYYSNTLKTLTLKFIKNSPMWLIMKTEGWSNIKSVELVKNIYENIIADGIHHDLKQDA